VEGNGKNRIFPVSSSKQEEVSGHRFVSISLNKILNLNPDSLFRNDIALLIAATYCDRKDRRRTDVITQHRRLPASKMHCLSLLHM